MSFDTAMLAAVITGIIFPCYVLFTGKKTIRTLEENPGKLTSIYKETGILLILMAIISTGSMMIEKVPLEIIGLGFIDQLIWILLLAVAAGIFFFLVQKMKIPDSKMESLERSLGAVQHILPQTILEYRWAVTTAFIAGVCEEILFRGFLFWQLNQLMPVIPAVITVNVIFGIGHAATKLNNAIKAFGLGLLFSVLFVATGSLWLSILAHIIIDLYAATISIKFSQKKVVD